MKTYIVFFLVFFSLMAAARQGLESNLCPQGLQTDNGGPQDMATMSCPVSMPSATMKGLHYSPAAPCLFHRGERLWHPPVVPLPLRADAGTLERMKDS